VKTGEVRLDLAAAHKHKADVVRRQAKGIEFLMKKNNITVVQGHGPAEGPGMVEAAARDGGVRRLATKNVRPGHRLGPEAASRG